LLLTWLPVDEKRAARWRKCITTLTMNSWLSDLPDPQRKIRIMIVEDHPLLIHGLRKVIENEPDMDVVAEVNDGAEAVLQALRVRPDVILMDINLPHKNGLQATREIKTVHGEDEMGVVILTAYHDDEQLYHALCAGASAYFQKNVEPVDLLPAVRAAAEGKYVIHRVIMGKVEAFRWLLKEVERFKPDKENALELYAPLSDREMDILLLITQGESNKQIAYSLNISPQTVKNHISSVLRKLGAEDRTQAAVLALRRGWVRFDQTIRRDARPSSAHKN
jgi:two-component system response regulator DegU